MLTRFIPLCRRSAPAAVVLMLTNLAVAGTIAAPAAAESAGRDGLRTDEMVPLSPVETGQAEFVDPSADQVWQADQAATSLPGPASVEFTLGGAGKAPAGFPVAVREVSQHPAVPAFAASSGSVTASVVDTATAAGVAGMLVTLSGSGRGPVEAGVDYSGFADRYGGAWASRLRLVELPACALTTPEDAGCLAMTPLVSHNNGAANTVSARLELSGGNGLAAEDGHGSASRVLAVTAGSESDGAGDYRATDLSPAGSWTSGGGDGAFTYSYPVRVPPAAGPVPSLSLGYSSASHDGRTSGRNGQASWIGDGWGYHPGFVERSYRPCSLDEGGNTPAFTGDQCWDADGASLTMSLNGTNTTLVRDDATGEWKAQADANWRIERLGSPASSSGGTSERWQVTTPDGTRYFFASESGASGSRLTVPVFGNHSGEPCKASAFKDSSCRQAYRWLLDKTIDVHDNMVRYFYTTSTGHYGAAGDPDNRVAYHRAARLQRIEYGLRAGDSSVPATGRVIFTSGNRCLTNCGSQSDPNETNWPDTPWDLHCDAAPCSSQLSPTYFSTHRLQKITTQVRDGSGWDDVDSWTLTHEFKDYGDDEQVTLWLKSIQHTGHVGGEVTLPKTTFAGEALPNRVDAAEGVPVMWRWRMSSIKSETGGITTITYAEPECTPGNLPTNKHANSKRCYPVRWTPELFHSPVEDWFHKHVVDSVVETDTTGGSVAVETYYDYATAGGGTSVLWGFDESEFTADEHRTYNMWRGYPQVTTRLGDPTLTQTATRNRFYRGLHGQPLPSGGTRSVSLTDAEGNTVNDHEALAGRTWERLSYNGSQVIEGATFQYWKRKTATQERDHDGGDLEAWLTGVSVEQARTRLTSTAWQRTETRTTFDDQGRATNVNDRGDMAKSGDELCTRNEYADNNTKWIKSAVKRVEVVSVGCGTSTSRPADLVSDTKTYFDGSNTHGATPSKGMPTRVDTLDAWDSGPEHVTTRMAYDALGRAVSSTDALGHTTTTDYTPSTGPVTRTVSTNPLGHEVTTELAPAWGEPVATTDPNGRRADLELDPLGRSTAVWLPGRDKTSQPASMTFEYLIRNNAPSAVISKSLNPAEDYVTNVELYDSLLRKRQTQTETHYRGRLVTETVYDTHGRVEEEYGPNPNENPPGTTIVRAREDESARRIGYFYDAAGRVVDEVFYDKHEERWRTTTSYGGSTAGFMVSVRPPQGAPATATITDARGRTIEKRSYLSSTPTGSYDSTTYEYTPSGQMEAMADPAGNEWSWEYDLRGQQVAIHHPDAGTSTMAYDAAGRPVSVTDARGRSIETGYDELGRPVTRHDGDGTLQAEWEYDTAVGGIGMPGKATRWHDGQPYTNQILKVGPQGLVTQTAVILPASPSLGPLAGTHVFAQSYTPDGQVALRTMIVGGLERASLQWGFDHAGNPTRMVYNGLETGKTEIVSEAVFTPYNEIENRLLGRTDERHAYHEFFYEEDTRRLARAVFDREASRHSVADVRYTYDDAGNVLSIADVPEDLPANHERQCFQYDERRRLVEAWTQGNTSGCAANPSSGVLGGPAPYWNSYDHDISGNRTAETLRTPGQPAVTHDYSYPAAGQPQPHTVRQVTGGPEPMAFDYDAAGHTTSRDVGGQVQTLAWNAEGRVESVDESGADTVEMIFDTEGSRLIRDDGETVTAFLPQTELTWNRTTDEVSGTRYFSHAGQVVVTNTGEDVADWTFHSVDHHGTTITHAVNAFTGVEQVRRTDPYGNPRGQAPPAWPGQQGFVGGVQDPTGLTHIGARSYDPVAGSFISADPILDTGDNQQINGYAYANNNPVTFTDPTGLALDRGLPQRNPKPPPPPNTGGTGKGRYCINTACTAHHNPGNGKPPHRPSTSGRAGQDLCPKTGQPAYCLPDPHEPPGPDPIPAPPEPTPEPTPQATPAPSPGPSPSAPPTCTSKYCGIPTVECYDFDCVVEVMATHDRPVRVVCPVEAICALLYTARYEVGPYCELSAKLTAIAAAAIAVPGLGVGVVGAAGTGGVAAAATGGGLVLGGAGVGLAAAELYCAFIY